MKQFIKDRDTNLNNFLFIKTSHKLNMSFERKTKKKWIFREDKHDKNHDKTSFRRSEAKHNRNIVPCEVGSTFSSSMQMTEKITFPIGLFFCLGFIILMDAYRFRVSFFFLILRKILCSILPF